MTFKQRKMQGKVKVFGSSKIMNSDKGYIFSRVIEKYEAKPQMRRGKKIKTGGKRKIYEGTTIQEDEEVRILVQDKELVFNVLGFFQSNVEMLEKTAQLISKHNPKGLKVLDKYVGAGTLSALCAEKAEHVTLVEHNRDAVVYAEKTLYHLPADESYRKFSNMYKKLIFLSILVYILILFPADFLSAADELGYRNWQTVLAGEVIAPLTPASFGFTAITDGGLLTAFSESGTVLWQKPMNTREKGLSSSFTGDFIFTAGGTTLSLYNPSGNLLWSEETPSPIIEKPFRF